MNTPMTTSLTLRSLAATLMLGIVLLLILGTPQAQAQSEVTGTLSSGAAATGSTATGTVSGGSGNTLTGTVIEEDNDGDGGGGGGGGSRRNNNDDDGDVLGSSTEIPGGMGGGGDFPGVPNTGVGPLSSFAEAVLLGSFITLLAGTALLRRYRLI